MNVRVKVVSWECQKRKMREELMRREKMGGYKVDCYTRAGERMPAKTKDREEKSGSAIRSQRMSGGFKMGRGDSRSPPSTKEAERPLVRCGCKSNKGVDPVVQLRVTK